MIRTTGKTTQAIFLSVAGSAMLFSGCNQSASVVMNRAGQGYYRMGHYGHAVNEFRQALVGDPNNADYAANLAMALQKSGDSDGAEKMYRRALTANPGHQGAYREYSRMLANHNRPAEALALMQQYVGTEGYRAEPHLQLAELHREMGNRTGEAHALQQALNISPQHPVALASMGSYFQDVGQTQTAMKMYERSLQANRAQPEVYSRYAALQGQVQRAKQAKATLARSHQQTGPQVAAISQPMTNRVVQVPQSNFAQAQSTIANRYQMAFVPDQVSAGVYSSGPDISTLPNVSSYDSQGVVTYSESPAIAHESAPFYSDSHAIDSQTIDSQTIDSHTTHPGYYDGGSTAGLPTNLNGTVVPSTAASTTGVPVEGPRIAVSPTRISSAPRRKVIPRTVVPSRSRADHHDHDEHHEHSHDHRDRYPHEDHAHDHEDAPVSDFYNEPIDKPPVSSSSAASNRLIFDDGDILGDTEVWDPIESTKDKSY